MFSQQNYVCWYPVVESTRRRLLLAGHAFRVLSSAKTAPSARCTGRRQGVASVQALGCEGYPQTTRGGRGSGGEFSALACALAVPVKGPAARARMGCFLTCFCNETHYLTDTHQHLIIDVSCRSNRKTKTCNAGCCCWASDKSMLASVRLYQRVSRPSSAGQRRTWNARHKSAAPPAAYSRGSSASGTCLVTKLSRPKALRSPS